MNCNLINLVQLMLLLVCFSSIFYYALHSYKNLKYKFQQNIIKNILLRWFEFIKALSPEQYINYEKYGIWRYFTIF